MERVLRVIPFIPLALLVVSFGNEITISLRWIVLGTYANLEDLARSFPIAGTLFLWFLIFFVIWLILAADQTILPVTRLGEVILTACYLVLHFLGRHGLAAYLRNGRLKAYVEELRIPLPGVVLVDFNGAIAVEQTVQPRGFGRDLTTFLRRLAYLFRIDLPPIRIQGAGLIFLLGDERIYGVNDVERHPLVSDDPYWMERILGVVDLRNQFRRSGNRPHPMSKRLGVPVLAYTRDGIEVTTNITVQATLGHDPARFYPLTIAYVGDQYPRNLRVVGLKTISRRAKLYRIESFSDDLDQWDRLEIHQQWQAIQDWVEYDDVPSAPTLPSFNEARVFAAIFARARYPRGLGGADEIIPWVDLSIHVAVDLFREIISHYNYDEIYLDVNGGRRVGEVRAKLAAGMRNSGLLSWRPLCHRYGEELRTGDKYLAKELRSVPPDGAFSLLNSKILRDRGIRVISARFGDLSVDERIYKQRLDNWRAAWDRETEIVDAGREWESTRVRTQARIQAQQEFVQSLSQIYQTNTNSREIIALRVLQALEMAAADPKTRQLLPDETFSMLRSIHDWLLPQDMGLGPNI